MHVGVEEAVAEHLREEDLDAGAREPRDVDALLPQRRDLVHGRAVHALHHHHVFGAVIPVDLGHEEQRRAFEVAPELARVRRLAHEIELVVEVLGELRRRRRAACSRLPSAHRRSISVAPACISARSLRDDRGDARPQHFHRDLGAVGSSREMDLRDRSARDRLAVEAQEDFVDGSAVDALERREHLLRPETAARGPAALRARPRCRSAADRGASTAPVRT